MRLHHVQVACPAGGEDEARRFWAGGLGLTEVEKPAALGGRGGAWFRAHARDGTVTAELHVGVEDPFRPAAEAHPALLLASVGALEATGSRLRDQGYAVDDAERDTFPGHARLHVRDGHGNRVELLATV